MYEELQELLIEHYICMYVCLRGACVLDSIMGLSYFIFLSHVMCVCVHLVNMRSVYWSHDCCALLCPGCVQAVLRVLCVRGVSFSVAIRVI